MYVQNIREITNLPGWLLSFSFQAGCSPGFIYMIGSLRYFSSLMDCSCNFSYLGGYLGGSTIYRLFLRHNTDSINQTCISMIFAMVFWLLLFG